jgi:hypothetical protein
MILPLLWSLLLGADSLTCPHCIWAPPDGRPTFQWSPGQAWQVIESQSLLEMLLDCQGRQPTEAGRVVGWWSVWTSVRRQYHRHRSQDERSTRRNILITMWKKGKSLFNLNITTIFLPFYFENTSSFDFSPSKIYFSLCVWVGGEGYLIR